MLFSRQTNKQTKKQILSDSISYDKVHILMRRKKKASQYETISHRLIAYSIKSLKIQPYAVTVIAGKLKAMCGYKSIFQKKEFTNYRCMEWRINRLVTSYSRSIFNLTKVSISIFTDRAFSFHSAQIQLVFFSACILFSFYFKFSVVMKSSTLFHPFETKSSHSKVTFRRTIHLGVY